MLEEDAVIHSGQRVVLSPLAGKAPVRETEIEFFRRQHGRCVAKFRGIDSISEAEKHIGDEVKVPAGSLPEPRKGFFYTFQLKGCRVFTAQGEDLGSVTDVIDSGGTEILKVDLEAEETLIPFAEEYIRNIDLEARRIQVDLPEGLRELNK